MTSNHVIHRKVRGPAFGKLKLPEAVYESVQSQGKAQTPASPPAKRENKTKIQNLFRVIKIFPLRESCRLQNKLQG